MSDEQLGFFDDLTKHEIFSDIQPHIMQKFWEYHRSNPHVFDLYLKFARDVRKRGFKKYGVRSITERIRWHFDIEANAKPFKLNDHYHGCYARLMIALHPFEFEHFFELRSPQKAREIYKQLGYHDEQHDEFN